MLISNKLHSFRNFFLQIHILITPIFIGFRSGENFDSISCKKIRKARTHRTKE